MTPEQKRIAIAEACGWTKVAGMTGLVPDADRFDSQGALETRFPVPDYFSNLNACAEFEATLDDSQIDEYKHRLQIVVTDKERISQCATAAQRCDAFLLVKGLIGGEK